MLKCWIWSCIISWFTGDLNRKAHLLNVQKLINCSYMFWTFINQSHMGKISSTIMQNLSYQHVVFYLLQNLIEHRKPVLHAVVTLTMWSILFSSVHTVHLKLLDSCLPNKCIILPWKNIWTYSRYLNDSHLSPSAEIDRPVLLCHFWLKFSFILVIYCYFSGKILFVVGKKGWRSVTCSIGWSIR